MKKIQIPWLLSTFLLIVACVKNPVTGGRQLALIGEGQEIAIGEASHPEILREFGIVENQALQEYFARIGMELAKISHRPDLPWRFTILDSHVVNAFAVPGGFVYFTRGILANMNNEAELAGVLGHEIGHITARHSVSQISRQQLLGLGLGAGSILSPTFRQLGSLAETGVGLFLLKNSRDHERQSDQLGIQYAALAGYDPEQLSRFFEVVVDMREKEGEAIPNWLSTHPSPPDRIKATESAAIVTKSKESKRDYRIDAEPFLTKLEGLVYGEDPREGFEAGGQFVHPGLRFQLDVPVGWKVQNAKEIVVLAEPQGTAIMQLILLPPEEGQSPEEIGRKIGRQQGSELVEGAAERIHGNQAFIGRYRVQTTQGILGVSAAFIAYGGRVFQISGLTTESSYPGMATRFNSTLRSFRELTDPNMLNIQPDRITIHRSQAGETIRSLAVSAKLRISAEEISRLNRIAPDRALAAGTLVKLIRSGR